MSRVASSLYDGHFAALQPSQSDNKIVEPALNVIRVNNNIVTNTRSTTRTLLEWEQIFPTAAFFEGRDIKLGEIVIMVYEDPDSKKISTTLFSALGEMSTNSLTLDERSRFFAACENLTPRLRSSNVRRALAITLLKAYSAYISVDLSFLRSSNVVPLARDWDETVAGEIASQMKVITSKTPMELGKQLLSFGFLQQHYADTTTLDVVYSDAEDVIDANNKLVFLLGQQLEHLFDPLTEYSPESTDLLYKPPEIKKNFDDDLTRSICNELFQLQESITTQLVKFLREVVIPIRIKALTGKIPELSAAKVNKIFPPTMDEVTRVNCIFFEALKAAIPHGSYEVMKACGVTIPYFYKAYMRHESALKSFSQVQAEFLDTQNHLLPPAYSPPLISSIMKVPLNLTKIKLILERLLNTKQWSYIEEPLVNKFYKSSVDTINSFGMDDLKPYNRRVFTPTGKILTEICEGWPAMLAYGWLNRKVISVFDTKDNSDGSRGIVVLFNDYVIFAKIDEEDADDPYMTKPKISDVLMNSLINEHPINTIPNMKVTTWTELGSLEVVAFGDNNVRVILKNDPTGSLSLSVDSSSKFMSLINKAKILGKSTPFHLFKNEKFGLSIFATAHEKSIYEREHSRSKVALFLNETVDFGLLKQYGLFAAISARFTHDEMIRVEGLTIAGDRVVHTINTAELPGFISEEVSSLETRRRSILNPELAIPTGQANRSFVQRSMLPPHLSGSQPGSRKSSGSRTFSIGTTNTSVSSARMSSISSANRDKPLPKIKDKEVENVPKKKSSKLKNRLSQIFGMKKKKSADLKEKKSTELKKTKTHESKNSQAAPNRRSSAGTLQNKFDKPKSTLSTSRVASQNSTRGPKERGVIGNFTDGVPEVSTNEDSTAFESSMTPIFDDDLPELNVQTIAESSTNWVLTRDNSSVNCNLDKLTQLNRDVPAKITTLFGPENTIEEKAEAPLIVDPTRTTPAPKTATTPSNLTPVMRNLTFRSIDDEFNSPVLRVGVSGGSMEDVRNEDIFYTPKSYKTEFDMIDNDKGFNQGTMFGSFDTEAPEGAAEKADVDDAEKDDGEARRWSAGADEIKVEPVAEPMVKMESPLTETLVKRETLSTENTSTRASSFKSCMDDNELVLHVLKQVEAADDVEPSLKYDESFRYLAEILGNPFTTTEVKKSETYQTLPRSFSSHKYLAEYITSDSAISSDLFNFLQEH